MKSRLLTILAPILAAGVMVLAVFAFVRHASAIERFSKIGSARNATSPGGAKVLARRAISIPFGIEDALFLVEGGNAVSVTGHGTCPQDSERYQLRTEVTQGTNAAKAVGRTEGDCSPGETITWSALAVTPKPQSLQEGPAQACGKAVIFRPGSGAITFAWCKPVTLVESTP